MAATGGPRRFPSGEEIAAALIEWRSEAQQPPATPADVARRDQRRVAARENLSTFSRTVTLDHATGEIQVTQVADRGDLDDPVDMHTAYTTVQTIMVADSVGIRALCPHSDDYRPLVLFASHAALVCADCRPDVEPELDAQGAPWSDCDRCGANATPLRRDSRPYGLLLVVSSICGFCSAIDEAAAEQRREFAAAARNDPCPCGSGRKFKRCHGGAGGQRSR